MTTHNYLAVIGRVSGDDNDCFTFENMTTHEAEAAMVRLLIENRTDGDDVPDPADVFIDFILTSESPIVPQFAEAP